MVSSREEGFDRCLYWKLFGNVVAIFEDAFDPFTRGRAGWHWRFSRFGQWAGEIDRLNLLLDLNNWALDRNIGWSRFGGSSSWGRELLRCIASCQVIFQHWSVRVFLSVPFWLFNFNRGFVLPMQLLEGIIMVAGKADFWRLKFRIEIVQMDRLTSVLRDGLLRHFKLLSVGFTIVKLIGAISGAEYGTSSRHEGQSE